MGISDVSHIGDAMDIVSRGTGAVVAIVTVAGIMLAESPPLGLVVLIGVPLILAAAAPLLRPYREREERHRELVGELTAHARFTAIAAAEPRDAQAIADRLARYAEGDVTYGGTPLAALADVRERILLAVNEDRLFSGRLAESLTTPGTAGGALERAIEAANAKDIVAATGMDAPVAEAGREFSGGQQQRLRLVRALAADPEVLILVEPTSAVDAHTEARIADRLGAHRAGRTTVVCTTSPLMLDRADHVAYVEDGTVVAEGTHQDLLALDPRYAATVTRGEANGGPGDAVGVVGGVQAVRDGDDRPPVEDGGERAFEPARGARVEERGRLVQDQGVRVGPWWRTAASPNSAPTTS